MNYQFIGMRRYPLPCHKYRISLNKSVLPNSVDKKITIFEELDEYFL